MISERTLKQWRKDALVIYDKIALAMPGDNSLADAYREQQQRILRLTQELMDFYLVQKGR